MEQKLLDLTNPQKTIWLTEQFYKGKNINNVCGTLSIKRALNFDILEKAINLFVKNNDANRIRLRLQPDGTVMQYFVDYSPFKVDTVFINSEEELEALRQEITSKPFELLDSPLVNFTMFKFPNNYGGFIANFHHTISDSWSCGITSDQILDNYCKLLNNEEIIFDSSLSYKNYISTEKDYLNSPKFLKDKAYWENIYSTFPENATIPASLSSDSNSLSANRLQFNISSTLLAKINNYCISHKVSPFNFYMALFGIYLGRVSNFDDFVIGTPILNRTNYAEKHTPGMFINTIPFRIKLDYNSTFSDYVSQISINSMGMLRHQKYSYQYIIDDLRKKDSSLPTLYNVVFSYQITKMCENKDFPHSNSWTFTNNIYDDIDIHMMEYDDNTNSSLHVVYDYRTTKYTKSDIKSIHSRIINMIKQIIENDNILLKDIDIVTEKEKTQILNVFNDNYIDIPYNTTLNSMFNKIVEKYSNNIAVVHNTSNITYQELDQLSTLLAHTLLEQGVKPQDVIGICLNRSIELIIGIWAILKVGAVYMPMYTKYPTDRLNYMLENSNCSLVITNSVMSDSLNSDVKKFILNNINDITCKDNSPITTALDENNLAYVIYTSGSTGKPKGVQITHKNLVNFIYAFNKSYNKIDNEDNFLASTNISFDVSIFELFLSILNGAKLILYNEEYITDIINYTNYIINNNITMLYIPPNILNDVYTILKGTSNIKINKLLVGVEGIKKSTLNKYYNLNPKMIILNGYGPTETTICATTFAYKKDLTNDDYVSIGKPLSNNNIYILSKNNSVQPIGVLGELCISGFGVGKGYINNEAENSKHFIINTFDKDSKCIYKTGDLAKWNSDGTITFVGRNDTQIKLHGYRIELSEINNVINQNPYILKSLTTVKEIHSNKYIVTYFTSHDRIETDNLDLYLKGKLPFYMVPNFYIHLDSFPLTANGKIDMKKLPLPKENYSTKYIAPTNKTEKILCEIWKELFNLEKISVTDNFFSLGGDSLTAIKFQIEALKHNINISYSDIFQYSTIKLLSEKKLKSENIYDEFSNYDYTAINNLLSINTVSNIDSQEVNSSFSGNLLLLGSTGFLGAHILDNYLSNCSGIAYCIVRNKSSLDEEERLRKTLNFYFNDKYNTFFGKRIKIIHGDIVFDNFGLQETDYEELGKKVDVVINSAALVKHYGDFKLFDEVNVLGTKHIINFCKQFNKKLYHISTISVSGASTPEDNFSNDLNRQTFDETQFYIGQNLNNAYIFTKFAAEKCIFEEINNGLKACIFRIGNISNRNSDAKFQINTLDNAYINRIKSLIKLGLLPKKFLEHSLEFTPVDSCADAIIKIVFNNPKFNVFHLFNTNLISIPRFIEILYSLGYILKGASDKEFADKIDTFLQDDVLKDSISGIIPDLNSDKNLNLISNVLPIADFTTKYLKTLNFNWPEIDVEYITKYIEYFKNIGYLE